MSFFALNGILKRGIFSKVLKEDAKTLLIPSFSRHSKRSFGKKEEKKKEEKKKEEKKKEEKKKEEKENCDDLLKKESIRDEEKKNKESDISDITQPFLSYMNEKEKIKIEILNQELKNIEEKIKENTIIKREEEIKEKKKEITTSDFKYPCQKYYKANEEEIKLFKKSEREFYLPIECENSTIIRLINIKNKISSPLLRCVRNSKIGLRKKERKFYLLYSSLLCSGFFLMGVWQYKKVDKKKFLIDYIIQNLNEPVLNINDSDFPWYIDFVDLKQKAIILNKSFLEWQKENDKIRSFSFIEKWKKFKERLFSVGFYVAWKGRRNETKQIKHEHTEKEKAKVNVNFLEPFCVSEWVERVRNENMFFKLIRKIRRKTEITEDELKKVVIEKYKYRKVEVTGVLDTSNEFYVGPKLIDDKKDKTYYYAICPLYLKNGRAILINRGLLQDTIVNEKTNKQEIPKIVTIRGILDPGELYESSFKKIKNFSNKNKYTNYFFYYEPTEICHYANISDFPGSTYFILNVYDIVFHEDLLVTTKYSGIDTKEKSDTTDVHSKLKHLNDINFEDIDRESKERIKELLKYGNNSTNGHDEKSTVHNKKPFRYDEYFIHKKKKDYLKFFADENTHFSYACQWFLFSFLFSSITIFKFIQFKRWVF